MKKPIMLQYTIDEDQLPAEAARLLGNSIERLMGITAAPPEEDEMLTTKTMIEVNALRQELAGVDTMLGDVSSIIDQYLEYQFEAHRRMTNSEGEIEIPNEHVVPDLSNVDLSNLDINDLKNKLQHLQTLPEINSKKEMESFLPDVDVPTSTIVNDEEEFNAQIHENDELVNSLREAQTELQGFTDSGITESISKEAAMAALTSLNEIDFSDLENIGQAVSNWKAKIG